MQWFGKWLRCAQQRSGSRRARIANNGERLEARHFLAAMPVITEFVASNESSFADGDGASSDWIEIYNAGDEALDLVGWHLTDDNANRDKWTFPSVVLAPETFLVVFASGQATETYVDAGGNLHTDFALSAGGEFLGLVDPDGQTVVSSFTPEFPPQLTDISYGRTMARGQVTSSGIGYFLNPTPGAENASAVDNVGPIVTEVEHAPAQPSVGETLTVTAFVEQTGAALGQVNLVYRIMFGQDTTVPMNDQGAGGDATAGDGVFTGVIPATATAGQMVRYYVSAGDVSAKVNRFPQVNDTTGTDQSPQYFGTMVVDTRFNTNLPVFSWFAQNPSAADTRSGARGSVYYAGEFYDNIFIRQRGGATNGGSQKFNFNDDQPFYLNEELGRVLEINMNAQGLDPSYVRQSLGFETHQVMGVPSNASFLMRMQMNATFDRVGVFIEQTDEVFLERHGYDPEGALYKMVQRSNLGPAFSDTITGLEKKTRLDEGIEDMQALVNALYGQSTTAASRRAWLYDNFNVPELLNYLAARSITLEADDVRKNFYMYRDTNGTGEWSIFPWDKDMNFGIEGDGAPHLHHPYFGDEEHAKANANQWNVLYDVVFETPDLAQMYLRRLRSLTDEFLQNSRIPLEERYFESRVDAIYATAAIELPGAAGAVNSLKNWFNTRRSDLLTTYNVANPRGGANNIVPLEQLGNPALVFGTVDVDGVEEPGEIVYNPVSGDQDDEYLTILNPTADAVDISGWTLSGGVEYTFAKGVVVPAGGTLYVSPNVVAFRSRESGPSGGQGLFVQGTGQHISNGGATIEFHAADGQLMDTVTTPEVESSQQKSLRIVELMYHPTDSNTAEIAAGYADAAVFEYVEFQNIGDEPIDLAGASFSVGIDGTIAGAGVMLAPGERALLVSNPDAFAMRYDSNARIVGTFTGKLDNAGERLKLEDAAGETILDFIYDDGWYPSTDGDGYSLEIVDELADTIAWSQAAQWKASEQLGGTPGTGAQTELPGDANGDGRVDLEDLNAVRNNFGATGEDVAGDTNGDGRVDLEDLNAVRNNFGATSSSVAIKTQWSDWLFSQQSSANMFDARATMDTPLQKGRRPHVWVKM
jgi:hypothetical protein